MKSFIITIVLISFLSFGFSSNKTKVKITSKSEVIIKGKSNVNSFECKYNSDFIEDEILISVTKNNSRTLLEGAKISIQSKGFDCGHKIITKDFKTLLKADDYSHIDINLKELILDKKEIIAKTCIEIAGVKREYEVPVSFDSKNSNVKGVLRVNIKDFCLKAPKKLLGFVMVDEHVTIDFNLFLQY